MPRPRTRPLPNIQELRDKLAYDPYTGIITWRAAPIRKKCGHQIRISIGDVAGKIQKDGYLRMTFDRIPYLNHRVAYAIFYGDWPPEEIDHIDRDKANNRITNLKPVTRKENMRNIGPYLRYQPISKNGFPPGVHWQCYRRKDLMAKPYKAVLRKRHLGVFHTVEEASASFEAAKAKAAL